MPDYAFRVTVVYRVLFFFKDEHVTAGVLCRAVLWSSCGERNFSDSRNSGICPNSHATFSTCQPK